MSTNLDGIWSVDHSRSKIAFRVRHFGVATVRGRFTSFGGRLEAADGRVSVEGHVDVTSVDTGNEIRDERLRAEFFEAEQHPAITLNAGGTNGGQRVRGELTLRGVARPVDLELRVEPGGDGTLRVRAEGRIRRSDFGLEWEALRQAGRLLVADEVKVRADVVLTRS